MCGFKPFYYQDLSMKQKPFSIDLSPLHNLSKQAIPLENSDRKVKRVLPYLFLSDSMALGNTEEIVQNNIKYVILLSKPRKAKRKTNLYHQINCFLTNNLNTDITKTLRKLNKIIRSIVKHKENILICCSSGFSLAPTVILAYLIRIKKFSFQEAFDYLHHKERRSNPNISFLLQLKKLDDRQRSIKSSTLCNAGN